MKVAVVGATGMVGRIMLQVLESRKFPVTQLIPVASEQSLGGQIIFNGRSVEVVSLQDAVNLNPDFALFSAGSEVSLQWAPIFAQCGTVVIDNSSAWRMDPAIKLIVPEVNANLLTAEDRIISNPNCSTIQLVMVLRPLHLKYGIKRVVISTYQSVTGTGKAAVEQMENERNMRPGAMVYPYPIDKNCLPQCDVFTENGYTKEEMKLVNETRKILSDQSIGITATAVRVPVMGGHSESVNLELNNEFDLDELRKLLSETEGVVLQDNPEMNIYPMPRMAEGKDAVFVGRIRRDESQSRALNMWIVADNLRKGAATNAIQIAEYWVKTFAGVNSAV
jgi:aspartate-semialdehyde dehydrogenase